VKRLLVIPEHENVRTDMISDVAQAHRAILIDERTPALMAQVQLLNITPQEAVNAMRVVIEELEKVSGTSRSD
jgi:hypothetical protein